MTMRVAALVGLAVVPAVAQQGVPLQGFSIVLVQGDMAGQDARSGLPEAAARAIADMKDFLPFKSYRLVDSSWVLSEAASGPISARLKGPDGADYDVSIEASPAAGGAQRVAFRLREPGADVAWQRTRAIERDQATLRSIVAALREKYETVQKSQTAEKGDNPRTREFLRSQLADAERRLAEATALVAAGRVPAQTRVDELRQAADAQRIRIRRLEDEMKVMLEKYKEDHPEMVFRRQQLLEARVKLQGIQLQDQALSFGQVVGWTPSAAGATLIDTTFMMNVGETVVVGTSRTSGNTALVAVLTAAPQQSRARVGF